jgi:hypothetical protein
MRLLHLAPQLFEYAQSRFADLKDARLARSFAGKITAPGDAFVLPAIAEALAEKGSLAVDR